MLVTIARYYDPTEAQFVRALLESTGVPATVADANHVTANWPIAVALGGVRVQVPHELEEQAREIIAAYASGDLQRDLEHELGDLAERCPSCDSEKISRIVPTQEKFLAVGVFLLAGASFPTRTSKVQCNTCRHIWNI